jgi:hypothetical protein
MLRILSDRPSIMRWRRLTLPGLAVLVLGAGTVRAEAQSAGSLVVQAPPQAAPAEVVSSEFSMSRETALLRLELADGRTLEAAVRDGAAFLDGSRIGDAPRGAELDRSFRELLNEGMDVTSAELPQLLAAWSPPGAVGAQMAESLRSALAAARGAAPSVAAQAAPADEAVSRLQGRIDSLERELQRAQSRAERAGRVTVETRQRPARRHGTLHYMAEGLGGIFSTLITYAVLFAIAFGVIMFGGRKYIEGVGDTARQAPGRSLLVGLAAAFLLVPVFILGILALIISIVGIPAVLLWAPGFPVAVVLACLLGYLGVAHAAGEAVAERRYYVTDWFQRGNSYYFLLSGLGVLLAFFLAASVVHMAGRWLSVISGMLTFLGVVTTATAVLIGFGATLISRGGTRPLRKDALAEEPDLFREEAGV